MFTYKKYIIIIAASIAISIGIQMILPFPYGLIVVVALFILFPLVMRKMQMSRMGGYGGQRSSGGGFFGMGSSEGSSVRYVCLVCNNKHKGGSCPRCGSKMQRADF